MLISLIEWFVRRRVTGRPASILGYVVSRIFLYQHIVSNCSFQVVFFFMHFVGVQVVHLYSSTDKTIAWMKSQRCYFHVTDNLSMTVYAFARCMKKSLSVDETLLPRYVNLSFDFSVLLLKLEIVLSYLKLTLSVLFAFTQTPLVPADCSS